MPTSPAKSLHLYSFAVVLVSALLVGLLFAWFWKGRDDELRACNLDRLGRLLEQEFEEFARTSERIATTAKVLDIRGDDRHRSQRSSEFRFVRAGTQFGLVAYDRAGEIVSAAGPQADLKLHGAAFEGAVNEDRAMLAIDPPTSENPAPHVFSFAPAGDNASGLACVATSLPLKALLTSVPALLGDSESEVVLILDGQGRQIFSSGAESSPRKNDLTAILDFGRGVPAWSIHSYSTAPLAGLLAPLGLFVLPFLLAFGSGVLLAFGYQRRIAEPVEEIGEAVRKFASGSTETRILPNQPVDSRVGETVDSINELFDHFADNQRQLESAVQEKTTRLRLSQESLHGTTVQMRAAFESLREGIMVVSRDGRVIEANSRILDLFNIPGRRVTGLPESVITGAIRAMSSDPDDFREQWSNFSHNPDESGEMVWELGCHADQRVVDVYTAPVRMSKSSDAFARVWIFRDVTEVQLLEDELRQSQKMEAVGRLAGGIAHDFNNLLTAISGNLGLAIGDIGTGEEPERIVPKLRTALQASERGASLVSQMLGYSRRSRLVAAPMEVGGVVESTHRLLRHSISPKVQVRQEIGADTWPVFADANQVEQVLLNICVNASDAIGEEGGTITLRTDNRVLEQDGHTASYVEISVSDDGPGIEAEVLGRIFEPFFTTKDPGKGTGLGLAMCYGIIKQHKGWIDVDSEMGKGTTFRIFIPRSAAIDPPIDKPADDHNDFFVSKEEANQLTVLIADDEAAVCQVAETILKTKGYNVLTASDGQQAYDLVKEQGYEIDIVILDLTMPVLNGKEAFAKIVGCHPDLPCLICSGYLVDLDDFRSEDGIIPAGFVQKPYALKQFLEQVSQAVVDFPRDQAAVS